MSGLRYIPLGLLVLQFGKIFHSLSSAPSTTDLGVISVLAALTAYFEFKTEQNTVTDMKARLVTLEKENKQRVEDLQQEAKQRVEDMKALSNNVSSIKIGQGILKSNPVKF